MRQKRKLTQRNFIRLFALTITLTLQQLSASESGPLQLTSTNPRDGFDYRLDKTFSNKKVHVLEIDLTHPMLSLRASANEERGLTPSEFSTKTSALAVINGDFFNSQKKPVGLAAGRGQIWPGTMDSKEWSFLACTEENDCTIDEPNTLSAYRTEWTSVVGGWQNLLSPGFAWSRSDDEKCGDFCLTEHPRTAIGLNANRTTLWWVVVEGRQSNLTGLTLADTTRILKGLGARWALNLDGGGSSGMILNGRRVNGRPLNEPEERKVSNCLALVRKR
jgi:exopolysaccharide biosynthesis protein